ncbi:pseudouridine synthase [Jiella endophytica]|uniref:Pseudouridine synthase n=2 Tax=Jiella endophytica TaxID=2558362 RepID=A0A4Y8RCU4_9HYPH|nr:pseudouridine synthase [Jiella endophytica]
MLSHGGAKSDGGRPGRPKSYGSRSHDAAESGAGEGGERKPRPMNGERREGRASAPRGKDGEKGGFRRERPARAPRADGTERSPRSAGGSRRAGSEAVAGSETAGEAQLTMRIARRLARAGVASRRDAEAMIAEGRVSVNGKVIESPALDVGPKDRISVDGEALAAIERTRLWLFHKPAGLVTTNKDPEGRPTVFEKLPAEMPRVLSIGRLDINTEGLLLLTNDGGLARVLELPATGWLRRYRVRAHGSVDQAKLDELREGIAIDGVFYGAIEATLDRVQGANVWLTLGLREGKNREVKRVLGELGLDVNRLIRLSYGPFQLADLAEGAVREIHGKTLRDQLGPRLIEEAGADFDAPIVNPFSNKAVEAERAPRAKAGEPKKSRAETAPNKKRQREEKREDALGRLGTRADRPRRGDDRAPRTEGGERRARSDKAGRPGRDFGDKPQRSRGNARDDQAGPRGDAGGSSDGRGAKRFAGDRPTRGSSGEKPSGGKKFGDKKPFGDNRGGEERPARPPLGARRLSNVWIAPGGRPKGPVKAANDEAKAGRSDKSRALDATQRLGKKRTGPKPTSGAAGAGGPKRPKKG